MKKINLFAIIITVLLITSCKKSYTCDCTTSTVVTITGVPTGIPGFQNGTFTIPSQTASKAYGEKMSEQQATAACNHEKETLESTEKAAFDDSFKAYASNIKYSYSTRCSLK